MRFGCKQADDDSLSVIASRTRWSMAVSYMHSYCEESSGTLVISYFSLQEQQKNGIATPVKATGLQWVVTFKLLFSYVGKYEEERSSIKFGMLYYK